MNKVLDAGKATNGAFGPT